MITVPIRYRRSVKSLFVNKLQHAVPSFVVLGDGLEHLQHGARGIDLALGIAEIAVSVGVIGSVIYGFRQLRHHVSKAHVDEHHHHGVDWIDIAIAAMLAVEAVSKYRATGHLPRPTILLSVMMLAIGVIHPKLAAWGDRRRELRVSDAGISLSWRKFGRLSLKWKEVKAIEISDRYATVTATDGRAQRIDLDDVLRPSAVRDALMSARTFLDASRHAANASIESTAATS